METREIESRIRSLEQREDELRTAGASAVELEANRIDISQLQWELARALFASSLEAA